MTTNPPPAWFTAAMDALLAGDVDGYLQMYADDAVHEFPFAPDGAPAALEGKPAIAAYMRQIPARIRYEAVDLLGVREAGDELIVEAAARGTRVGSGEPFTLRYVWIITHDGGRVSRFRDYMPHRPRPA